MQKVSFKTDFFSCRIEQELMAKMISQFHSRLSPPEERTDSPESDKHDPG